MIIPLRGELELNEKASAAETLHAYERALQSRFDCVTRNATGVEARASLKTFFGGAPLWPKRTHLLIAFRTAGFVLFERNGKEGIAYSFESRTAWWMLPFLILAWTLLLSIGREDLPSAALKASGLAFFLVVGCSVAARKNAKEWLSANTPKRA